MNSTNEQYKNFRGPNKNTPMSDMGISESDFEKIYKMIIFFQK